MCQIVKTVMIIIIMIIQNYVPIKAVSIAFDRITCSWLIGLGLHEVGYSDAPEISTKPHRHVVGIRYTF